MRALCFRALKCGSGKQRKMELSWARRKKLGRNFMALARRHDAFWYRPGLVEGTAVVAGVEGGAFWARNALMRS